MKPPEQRRSVIESSRNNVLAQRQWKDDLSDTLDITVRVDMETGDAFTVITGDGVWLNAGQVESVERFLGLCQRVMAEQRDREHRITAWVEGEDANDGNSPDSQGAVV